MNTKLHAAVTDSLGRPIRFFMSAGQVSDCIGARAMMGNHPHSGLKMRSPREFIEAQTATA